MLLSASERKKLFSTLSVIDRRQPAVTDAVIIFIVGVLAVILSWYLDIFAAAMRFQAVYGDWGLDDLFMMSVVLSFALIAYGWRRFRELTIEMKARSAAEAKVREKVAALTEAQSFLHTIVENVPATIYVRALPEGRYVLINRGAEKMHGIPREKLIGKTIAEALPEPIARAAAEHDHILLQSAEPVTFEPRPITIPGQGARITVATGVAIRDDHGEPRYILNVIQDVTERKRAEAQIHHLAHHDSLTDLPNRAAFSECLGSTIERAAASGGSFAVMCIDLDRFKEVNDVFGHGVGDGLLCAVGKRLQAASEGAFIARLGGDEFTIICADGPQPASAEVLADRILQALAGDFEIAGHILRAGMSIGVAVYPTDGNETSVLLANADAALYRAKVEARGSIRFFESSMDKRLRERRALQHDLRSAIACNELTLYYQPQASMEGEITGFEALVRWNHPKRGMVAPGEFIPLAEESGLIVSLGEWVLREACREAATWPSALRIAINFSPVQFRHGDLPTLVHSVLLQSGLAANRLEIEITEGVLMDDFARGLSILRRLKALGVRIAMDDFGTGYSSLSYLQSFPFDKIKIDQAFVANLERNPQSAAIIRAVIGLGRGLNVPIVAEGVETKAQLAFLEEARCDEVQGFLIGRPEPIERYSELTNNKPTRQIRVAAG